jgi:hypothetical protein
MAQPDDQGLPALRDPRRPSCQVRLAAVQ